MASKINSCSYDPNGKKDFERINPVTPLQTEGDLDISYLVQEIVTKDFGYTGTSKYTLRLHNNKMVLELWNNPAGTDKQKYAKIKLEKDQWKRGATVLNDQKQTSNRLHHTLDRISRAYRSGQPGARAGADGTAELEATESANRGPVVNNYISCGHPACNHSIDGLQGLLQQQLGELNRSLSELERSIQSQQPRPAKSREQVDKLQETVDSLHQKLEKLQESIDKLQRENAEMKGLRDPLENISKDVPDALREIRFELEQLRLLLGDRLSVNSSGAQSQMVREMQEDLNRMRAQLTPLEQSVATLTKAYFELQTENKALKRQAAEQAQELSLKGREVEELNAKNCAQEERLSRLQAELDQEKVKHSQLHKDLEKEKGKTKRSGIAFNKVSEELEQAQRNSAQALSEKEQQLEELKRQLAASKEQNETIAQLRQQLAQTNTELAAAQRENGARQGELDAVHKAQSEAQEQLEQLYADLTRSRENEARSTRTIDELQLQNDILIGQVEETSKKLASAQAQLQQANDKNSEASEQILTLQGINKKLSGEQASFKKQISDQEALLVSAEKTAKVSEQTIATLNQSLKQKEQELEEQKRAATSAQETAQKAQKENVRLQKELEIQARKLQEAEASVAYLEDLLAQRSKMLTKVITEKILLESDYNEQTRVTNEMEELQNEHIRALEEQLTSLQAAASGKIDSTEHQAEVEQLKAQLLKAQQAQEETTRQRELSDAFYKKQNEEFQRRVNDLEQQLNVAKEQLVLEKRLAKQQREQALTIDLRSCPPMPESFSPPSDNAAVRVEQLVLSLQQSNDPTKDQKFEEKWLGPMLVNYALLDESVTARNVNLWLEEKQFRFQGAQLSAKSQNVTNQLKTKPRRIPTTSNTHEKIAGEIATALGQFEKFLKEIEKLPQPVTLASIFGMQKAYIARAILDYEQTVEPLLSKFESLGTYTGKSRAGGQEIPQRVEGARQLLGAVKTLRGSLFDMLDNGTWVCT